MINEQLRNQDPQKVRSDNRDAVAFFRIELVDRRFRDRNVVHEKRVDIADGIGQGGHVVGRYVDEFAHEAVRRHTAYAHVLFRKVFGYYAQVRRFAIGVEEHARIFGKERIVVLN